jgi:hypothetical protein
VDRVTDHGHFQDLLGAYALDAVDREEKEALELHLEGCPKCRAEVAAHQEMACLLGYEGGAAPEGLWARISASLEEPPPPLRLAPMSPGQAATERPARRRPGWRFAAVAAAAALVLGAAGVELVRHDRTGPHLSANQEVTGLNSAALAAATRPDARHATLRSPDRRLSVDTVVLPDGTGFVLRGNLPALPGSQTYQLWGLIGADRVSLAVLGSQPQVSMFRAEAGILGLAVTAERSGGVVRSEESPLVLALLDSP